MRIDLNHPNLNAEQALSRSIARKTEAQDGTDPAQAVQSGATARVPPAARLSKGAGVSRSVSVSDTAAVSGTADLVDALAKLADSSADVRQDRVQALRYAIGQGTYEISPERIADAMLAQATSKLR